MIKNVCCQQVLGEIFYAMTFSWTHLLYFIPSFISFSFGLLPSIVFAFHVDGTPLIFYGVHNMAFAFFHGKDLPQGWSGIRLPEFHVGSSPKLLQN